MNTERALIRALMGGTKGMRAGGTAYLPQERAESKDAYDSRLSRSFLFNGLGKTVRDMAGKVFCKPIAIGKDVPPALVSYAENVDLTGRNLDVFGHAVFVDALSEGISYILTDMGGVPSNDDGSPRAINRAEAVATNRRPWLVHIKAAQVLGWRSEEVNGVERLTQFRFMETVCEPSGEFGESMVSQVRVFSRAGNSAQWATYRKAGETADWVEYARGPISIGEIAIAPVYVARTGFMSAKPPLADLAEVNLAHWQSQSDQRNILHVARVPILFGSGFPADGPPLEIGAARMTLASDPAATLQYVEHSGAAIGAGRQDLDDLQFQMQALGLDLLVPRPGGQTATGAAIDQARMNAPLAMMATALKDALEQSFGFMGLYEGLGNDAGGSLTVNTDFGVSMSGATDISALVEAVKAGAISRATFNAELKRRGILSDAVNAEEEVLDAMNETYRYEDGGDEGDKPEV